MRVRTDARRQAIVDAAWEVFRENGFERTTMSDISERVGGSKATLYGYFQSKEQLFAAALEKMISGSAERSFSRLTGPGDLESRLRDFAQTYIETRLQPDSLAIERALIAEGERSDLGERLRQQFIQPHWRRLAAALDQEMQAGRLRKADPMIATWHFRGMIEVDLLERRLHGDPNITAHEVERAVNAGVETFLRAYAP
ncbi:MAG TPA: TetR/AcrR family transcriptional regulator [Phenylobacterium sp.]|nr:TetR/AcrR family transcriptional regulator [Phenylobacterium sp.]